MADEARLADQFSDVVSLGDLTSRTIEQVRRSLEVSTVNAVVFPATPADTLHVDIWSAEFPPDLMRRSVFEALPRNDVELGTIPDLSAQGRRCIDTEEYFASRGLDLTRTGVFNDYWHPFRVHRQALAFLGAPGQPIGFLCAARTRRERPFSLEDLRAFEDIRAGVERTLRELAPRPLEAAGALLGLLSREMPVAAAAFDSFGRVLWLTRAAATHLGIEDAPGTTHRGAYLSSRTLERWRGLALAAIRQCGLAEKIEGRMVVARTVQSLGGPVVLLTAGDAIPPESCMGTLSRREREVCDLVARGYGTINVSAVLGISEGTTRLHLKSIYRKLKVTSRTSLVIRLSRQGQPESGRGD